MEQVKIADHKRFTAQGKEFVFLTGTGTIFELEPESPAGSVLDHGRAGQAFTQSDLFTLVQGTDREKQALWTDLLAGHVLIDERAPAREQPEYPADTPINTLVLHVTRACNLMCRYCYHDDGNGTHFSSASMDRAVARQAVDFLFDNSGNLPALVLVFFGGEPLLNPKLISETIAYADKKAAGSGKKISYAMTTNGTILTDKVIAFIREHRIGMTVSIDGTRAAHDRFRRFPDGSPSYDVILPGVKRLLDTGTAKPVVARVTLAKAVGDIHQSLAHLLDLGFAEAGFSPVTTSEEGFMLDKGQMDVLLDQFQTLSDLFVEMALENRFLGFTNLVDLLVNLHEGEVRHYPCGAGMGMFSVDPQGGLFLCQRLTHDQAAHMGDVFNGFNRTKLAGFRKDAGLSNKKPCQGCWAASICAGGCYHEAGIRQGSLVSPNLHYCQWIKSWIETGLNAYARLAKEAPAFLDNLSLARGHEPLPESII
ncbi:MAG: radical SAM protein [Desulfobacterales bacterium]|nr:radical SAM protein [Desulfobacterales bacterium]